MRIDRRLKRGLRCILPEKKMSVYAALRLIVFLSGIHPIDEKRTVRAPESGEKRTVFLSDMLFCLLFCLLLRFRV